MLINGRFVSQRDGMRWCVSMCRKYDPVPLYAELEHRGMVPRGSNINNVSAEKYARMLHADALSRSWLDDPAVNFNDLTVDVIYALFNREGK